MHSSNSCKRRWTRSNYTGYVPQRTKFPSHAASRLVVGKASGLFSTYMASHVTLDASKWRRKSFRRTVRQTSFLDPIWHTCGDAFPHSDFESIAMVPHHASLQAVGCSLIMEHFCLLAEGKAKAWICMRYINPDCINNALNCANSTHGTFFFVEFSKMGFATCANFSFLFVTKWDIIE